MRNFSDATASTRFEGMCTAKINTITDGHSKAGDEMLTVEFKVIGQDFKDYIVKRFFVWDKNARAVNEFAKILDVIGVPRDLGSYVELHGKVCNIEVKYFPTKDQSEIVDYHKYEAPAPQV